MDLATARRLIRDPHAAYVDYVEASMVLVGDVASTDDDLLACLRRGGLPAESAAIRLGSRTPLAATARPAAATSA